MPEDKEPTSSVESSLGPLLERAGIRRACDLDLLVFFGRHPRSLLSSESLAAFLGYPIKQIADSLDNFLAGGLLRRRQTSAHSARLYELILDGPAYEWLETLLAQASTRPGRMALLNELDRRAQDADVNSSLDTTSGLHRVSKIQSITKVTKSG